MQPDILVTAPMPPFLYEPLKSSYRCHDYYKAEDKPGTLEAVGARIRGLVQGGGTVTPTSLLDALPALEIISVFGVGYDGVPVAYCKARGIKVTNTPDVLTDDVADVALGLILMTGRGFVRLNRFVHAGEWPKRSPDLATKLAGQKVGILGLGRIGKAIAARAVAMGMKIAYTSRKAQHVPYEFIPDLKSLAAAVDFLVVACPGGEATRNIVNAEVLEALRTDPQFEQEFRRLPPKRSRMTSRSAWRTSGWATERAPESSGSYFWKRFLRNLNCRESRC